jgi:hypothetical protein
MQFKSPSTVSTGNRVTRLTSAAIFNRLSMVSANSASADRREFPGNRRNGDDADLEAAMIDSTVSNSRAQTRGRCGRIAARNSAFALAVGHRDPRVFEPTGLP